MWCTHCIPKGEEHNPLCAVGRTDRAYAQGRADERAAIVAWLRDDAPGLADTRAHIAALIRTGCHEKEEP